MSQPIYGAGAVPPPKQACILPVEMAFNVRSRSSASCPTERPNPLFLLAASACRCQEQGPFPDSGSPVLQPVAVPLPLYPAVPAIVEGNAVTPAEDRDELSPSGSAYGAPRSGKALVSAIQRSRPSFGSFSPGLLGTSVNPNRGRQAIVQCRGVDRLLCRLWLQKCYALSE